MIYIYIQAYVLSNVKILYIIYKILLLFYKLVKNINKYITCLKFYIIIYYWNKY